MRSPGEPGRHSVPKTEKPTLVSSRLPLSLIQTTRSYLANCPSYPFGRPAGRPNATSFPLRFLCLQPMAQEMRPSVSTCPAALSWFQSASNFIGSQFSRSDSIITRPTTEEFPTLSLLPTFTFAFLVFILWSNSFGCSLLHLSRKPHIFLIFFFSFICCFFRGGGVFLFYYYYFFLFF